jgi:hypothetical protein
MMRSTGHRRIAAASLAAACLAAIGSLAGCSTATPVLLQAAKLPALQGRVNTTAGYAGEITTDNNSCRGSFRGVIGEPTAPLELSCTDGRTGVGTATIQDGHFTSGEVLLSDGSRLTIRPTGPAVP